MPVHVAAAALGIAGRAKAVAVVRRQRMEDNEFMAAQA